MSGDLDKAIDGAVREMLDVEPRADLRARVMAQIETPVVSAFSLKPVVSAFRRNVRVLAPIAAAAVIMFAVTLARRVEPVSHQPITARAGDHHLAPETSPVAPRVETPVRAAVQATRAAAPSQPRTGDARRADTVVATAFTSDDQATTAIDPLKPIAPIVVPAITHDRIAPADIAVRPLNSITELQVGPLPPADRR